MKKVSKNFIKVIKMFFTFFSFGGRVGDHSASLLTPLMVQFFFHQMPEFSNFLDIAMLGSYQKKKKKIQMWMIIFNKTKLQMNEMPVHFQEWGSNHKWIMATAELEQTQDDPAEAKATIGLIWH